MVRALFLNVLHIRVLEDLHKLCCMPPLVQVFQNFEKPGASSGCKYRVPLRLNFLIPSETPVLTILFPRRVNNVSLP
jgi:hypothetical protein